LGAIAAAYTNSVDPNQVVEELLLALKHRGTNKRTTLLNENSAFGYSSNGDMAGHLFYSARAAIAVDGSFYRRENPVKFVKANLAKATIRGGVSQVMFEPGGFAVLLSRGEKMFAFRDPNGLKPLYFATTRRVAAFASERKALWRIGLKETNRVFPGNLYTIGRQRIRKTQLVQFKPPKERRMTFDQAKTGLVRTLEKSIRIITKGTRKIAVAFSGGLDSAVAAQLAKALSQVELISVGLRGSSELSTVERYARELDLPISQESFDVDVVENYVRRIIWLIEEPNLMKVSVAIPLHWAATLAARRGYGVMLCGQGSDELYGGYYKYARILDARGRKALVAELYRSILEAAEVNYERDEQATSPSGIELRTPFADLDVIRFSLTIPSEYKVQKGNDVIRKWVLRASAKDLGIPDEIVWRRKKAIQHGTGVEKAVLKLAKSRNLTAEAYLAKVHAEVREMESMP
jgi:asparagine synthase (glutamine-hydrolysing)